MIPFKRPYHVDPCESSKCEKLWGGYYSYAWWDYEIGQLQLSSTIRVNKQLTYVIGNVYVDNLCVSSLDGIYMEYGNNYMVCYLNKTYYETYEYDCYTDECSTTDYHIFDFYVV